MTWELSINKPTFMLWRKNDLEIGLTNFLGKKYHVIVKQGIREIYHEVFDDFSDSFMFIRKMKKEMCGEK